MFSSKSHKRLLLLLADDYLGGSSRGNNQLVVCNSMCGAPREVLAQVIEHFNHE